MGNVIRTSKKQFKREAVNSLRLEIASLSANQSFARTAVAAFAGQLNPTLEEIDDIKTAVSEAVTNCVVHAYGGSNGGLITIDCLLYSDSVSIVVTDKGMGIANVDQALEPFYTTKPDEERSGMGFTVMQTFMDDLSVVSKPEGGTVVSMSKRITKEKAKRVCAGE